MQVPIFDQKIKKSEYYSQKMSCHKLINYEVSLIGKVIYPKRNLSENIISENNSSTNFITYRYVIATSTT